MNGPTKTKDRPVPIEDYPSEVAEANVGEIKQILTKADTFAFFQPFVLSNHEILDYQFGDLNADGESDVVLILKQIKEDEDSMEELKRPVVILAKDDNGNLKKVAQNDNIVLCKICGGVFGDPYMGIAIKNNYFSIEHYGGSSERWTLIITFKYDEEKKNWFLHKEGQEFSSSVDPNFETKESIRTTKDFGIVAFEKYNR